MYYFFKNIFQIYIKYVKKKKTKMIFFWKIIKIIENIFKKKFEE